MLRFWIRVNARLAHDADVQGFALAILPKQPEWLAIAATCGLLITLWGAVSDERENGDLNGVPDSALERWAGWQGKKGLFATEFRARFIDDLGLLREWQEYQGALIERRKADRERKKRGRSTGSPRDIPQEVQRTSGSNENNNDHPLASAPNGAERQEGSPLALAPSGARPAPRVNGGIPGAPPLTDDVQYAEYMARLAARAKEWLAKHPEQVDAFELEARETLQFRPGELTPARRRVLESQVHELVRERAGWPLFDTWLEQRASA